VPSVTTPETTNVGVSGRHPPEPPPPPAPGAPPLPDDVVLACACVEVPPLALELPEDWGVDVHAPPRTAATIQTQNQRTARRVDMASFYARRSRLVLEHALGEVACSAETR
jgi:hypothetical protein